MTVPPFSPVPCATGGGTAAASDAMSVTGLCLTDGTPVAIVVRRNAATGTVTQDGWVNSTTGVFTAGPPPAGTAACASGGSLPDQDLLVLCDVNASVVTPFIRDYQRDSAGAVVSVSNYTLAGAAYTPAGTVGACQESPDPLTLSAQARTLTSAAPWTPADVTGTLTSLTVTGLTGLWDVTDADGTVMTGLPAGLSLTWSAADSDTLDPPQSVTPQADASVVASWTER